MAKLQNSILLYLFIFLFLIVSTEMQGTNAEVCERRSKTWTGFCGSSSSCNRQCKSREGALSGACHAQFPGFACFCYFKC
ncbi:defensin-like protein 19 [Mercurialis annua]|uniref:defensin-like protein 19 n=1 Tax=Mercurialis annua TaxID=3986 RepID=UPI00215E18E0|nr:defensin-like protein 19 [Mercurialis annua]